MRCLDLRTVKGAAILHNVIIAGLSPLARQVAIMPRYVNIAWVGRLVALCFGM